MAISKRVIFAISTVIVLLIIGFFGFFKYTKSFSPAETVDYNDKGLEVEVKYCRPSKKGRQVFGSLVPFDKVWRTGANEATSFVTNKPLYFGDKVLKEGKYTLFTIPSESKWTFIFNGEVGQWGTQYEESKDVLRVETTAIERENKLEEQLKIEIEDVDNVPNLILSWENTTVKLPLQTARF